MITLFVVAVYDCGMDIGQSISDSMRREKKVEGTEKIHVELLPIDKYAYTDTLNLGISSSGTACQLRKINIAVHKTDGYDIALSIILIVTTPVLLFLLFLALFSFVRFVQDVKRERIFIRNNVKRLRAIGILFLFLGGMINIIGAIDYYFLQKDLNLNIPGYQVVGFEFDYTVLLVAFLFFLFAEIFSMGVRMKEEQDLTV